MANKSKLPHPPAAGFAFRGAFASALKAARKAASMTQAAAGASVGVSRAQWGLWETGRQAIRVEAAVAFARSAGGLPGRILLAAAAKGAGEGGGAAPRGKSPQAPLKGVRRAAEGVHQEGAEGAGASETPARRAPEEPT